jgi:hypothetical protein
MAGRSVTHASFSVERRCPFRPERVFLEDAPEGLRSEVEVTA